MGLYKLRNNPHPARGRKPPPGREAHQPLETTHTPQGDGNSSTVRYGMQKRSETTHTPQGDGNWCFSVNRRYSAKQPTPRKGTETTFSRPLDCPFQETTHTPQGDGNSRGMILTVPISETTHTPQGDGNLFDVHAFLRTRKQPTPRKGTETHNKAKKGQHGRNNPHPARGRKPEVFSTVIAETRNNPHPARGRKLNIRYGLLNEAETTHTPQGDGNPVSNSTCNISYRNNPHPARGTETSRNLRPIHHCRKQPTPRKGTETRARRRQTLRWTKQPTPRKGTETLHRTCSACAAAETTHTPQGDGKPFVFTLQKLLEKPFTSLTGDN